MAVASCVAVVAAVAILFPGARFAFLLPAAAVCGVGIMSIYSQCRFRSTAGAAILLAAYTLVVCGIIININYYTAVSGGTYAAPVLANIDMATDWSRAVHDTYGEPLAEQRQIRNYSYIISALLFAFGRDIGCPLIFNALCYGLTLIMFGAIAWQLTNNTTIATAAIAIAALMCYLMVQATVLLKDVPVTMCFAAVCLSLTSLRNARGSSLMWIILLAALATALTGFLRANVLLMLIVGYAIFALSALIAHNPRALYSCIGLCALAALIFAIMKTTLHYPSIAENIDGRSVGVFVHGTNTAAWDNMLPNEYMELTIWQKLVWLPASIAVQFLIPFPWNFSRDMVFGATEAVAHFGFFWYYAGAAFIFFLWMSIARFRNFAFANPHRLDMLALALWAVCLTAITAYMTSGRVSRYCLPYLPMILPCVVWTICTYWRRRSLWVWLAAFTILLVPTLFICHHLQTIAGA